MTGRIVKMLLVVIIVGYAALFVMWNAGYVAVCGIVWPPTRQAARWVEDLPVGSLPLIGAVLGAVLMAIATWGEWARQRTTARRADAQVQKAKAKLQELVEKIKQQQSQIEQLQARLSEEERVAEPGSVRAEGGADEEELS